MSLNNDSSCSNETLPYLCVGLNGSHHKGADFLQPPNHPEVSQTTIQNATRKTDRYEYVECILGYVRNESDIEGKKSKEIPSVRNPVRQKRSTLLPSCTSPTREKPAHRVPTLHHFASVRERNPRWLHAHSHNYKGKTAAGFLFLDLP